MIPRGIRNNNPGNIDYTPSNHWQGQLPHDPKVEARFCRFDTPENGIRALGKLLRTYQRKYQLKTVRMIINRWAPVDENNTDVYVRQVATALEVSPDTPIDIERPDLMRKLILAIIQHENGQVPYTDLQIDEGVQRALA